MLFPSRGLSFATALDAAGLPMPKDKPLDGKSILPALKGETDKLHDEFYWSSGGIKGKWAIRSGNWKLVGQKARVELFDLGKDLSETTNLARKHPNVVSQLTDKYNAWLDEMTTRSASRESVGTPMHPRRPRRCRKKKGKRLARNPELNA